MKIPYELWIGLRYTRAGKHARRNGFISFISAISMLGISLGVAALIVVISVMNGFQTQVRDRMLSVLPHIEIYKPDGGTSGWQQLVQEASKHPQVVAGAPFTAAQAMLVREDTMKPALVRGIDPVAEQQVSDLPRQVIQGAMTDLAQGQFGIVLGVELARQLGLGIGDKVTMITPQANVTPVGVTPRMRSLTVVGLVEARYYELDSSMAFMHVQDAQAMFRATAAAGVRLKVKQMLDAPVIAAQLRGMLPVEYGVRDWSQQNRSWFAAVKTEKRMMFLILSIIVAVAAFNLVSTLVMTVRDKLADIAILRTFGATPGAIQRVFIVQGAAIGLLGTALGVALGCLVAFNVDVLVPMIERALGIAFLPQDIYQITKLPSDPRLNDIVHITIVSCVMSLLATLYPSWRAARTEPSQALRYE